MVKRGAMEVARVVKGVVLKVGAARNGGHRRKRGFKLREKMWS